MYKFCIESDIEKFTQEIDSLMNENVEELNFFGLNAKLDMNTYKVLESVDRLIVLSMRLDSIVVGYQTFIVSTHLQHNDHLQANQDVIYINKLHRHKSLEFMRWCDKLLQDKDISFIFRSVTKFKDFSSVLKRQGFEEVETIFMKDLR